MKQGKRKRGCVFTDEILQRGSASGRDGAATTPLRRAAVRVGPSRVGQRRRAPVRRDAVRERRLAKFRQNVARFRLYRLRFLQENMRFAAFFKIYQILKLKFLKFDKILQILRHLQFFAEISRKLLFFQTDFLRKF